MNISPRSPNRLSLGILTLGVAWAGLTVGCTPDTSELRQQGMREFRNRQYIESRATLSHVLELTADDAQANYYMGLNYRALAARKFRKNQVAAAYRALDTAIIYFTQAVKSWPNYMEAVASKNEALETRGKYAQALALAEYVADNNRGDAADHFVYLGDEYRQRGDYDAALRAYKTALASAPDSSRAYAAMGRLYRTTGDLSLADDAFRRAHELNPREPGVVESLDQFQAAPDIRPAAHEPRE